LGQPASDARKATALWSGCQDIARRAFQDSGAQKLVRVLGRNAVGPERFLHHYNHERAHQGRNMNGRTPYQAFLDSPPEGQPKEDNEGHYAA